MSLGETLYLPGNIGVPVRFCGPRACDWQPRPCREALNSIIQKWGRLTKNSGKIWRTLFAAVSAFLCAVPCYAALGGDSSSVQADQARINASLRVTQANAYSVHELRSPTGVVVREFATSSGRIFAVAWHGPWPPDLQHLLGTHFAEFQQAMKSPNGRAAHGPFTIQQGNLVVELGGHMRDFVGRAYLSDQVPAGVRAEEIH